MDTQTDKNPKRQRDALEENVLASNELEAVLKKRRLAAGVENQNPQRSAPLSPTRFRPIELAVKPDTPAIASVRLRVQQLSQRRDGVAALVQRCMSDPGAESPSGSLLQDVCHIGGGEFSSRAKLFKNQTTTPESSPVHSSPSTRHLSDFVHNMQQQLNTVVTPSSKEASRIRQARDDELKSLRVQPLTENMWLKRSLSDPSLPEDEDDIKTKDADISGVIEMVGDSFNERDGEIQQLEPVVKPSKQLSTSALIDEMFEDVLQAANKEEEMETGTCDESRPSETNKEEEADIEASRSESTSSVSNSEGNEANEQEANGAENPKEGEKSSEEEVAEENELRFNCGDREVTEVDEENRPVCAEEDFLTLPPSCILSPLSKSMEAVVTPLLTAVVSISKEQEKNSQEEIIIPPVDSAPPLYSIDAYRSQRKNIQVSHCATPELQKQEPKTSHTKPSINTKETIKALNEETTKLQTVIHQTLQALSCCSDEEHGKGSLQEAEAEKLLLVSSEKHAALLAEISRLRQGPGSGLNSSSTLQPCRGTVSISSIQLPLKVEFVCPARTGRPTHYFFILIRYGPCNIVATPLATAADAENGDTIIFPTSITLQDIRSSFEIDLEVYSLSNSGGNSSTANVQHLRSSIKSRVTPRKLLNSITKSNTCSGSGTPTSLDSRRSSNFCLVGSHKITLASLGQRKFPLDKMKFEGKIRRLLGDEFQEKVPFLSPLEGHVYLQLRSESHSNIQHQGFLSMFEDVNGFGAWQRLFFKLEGGLLFYWNYPNEIGSKPAEGSISLGSFDSLKPVERDSCARPHTFELVHASAMQQDTSSSLTKSWFSADTREERADWMEKLGQVLLDLHTWNRQPATCENDPANSSTNTATSRESML